MSVGRPRSTIGMTDARDPDHRGAGTGPRPQRRGRRGADRGGAGARGRAQRSDPGAQLPGARDPGSGRLRRGLARALPPGGGHGCAADRLLRRALHGRDRLDPRARQGRADPRPGRRLLAGRVDHRSRASQLEAALPRGGGGDVRQHLGRGQGARRITAAPRPTPCRWSSTCAPSTARTSRSCSARTCGWEPTSSESPASR